MKKQMRLNALEMNCVGCCPGLWLHPEDQTIRYNTLEYWTDMARLLERGLFDSMFVADIFGIYDVYGGNADAAFRNAVEFPVNDPFLLVPAMAYHICEPSPQRTPVLFQAGASSKGRQFAARHAERVFITGLNRKMVAGIVSDIRKLAAEQGRDPDSLIIFTGLGVVTGRTDEETQAKLADYRNHVSIEGTLALFSGYLGIDLSKYHPDQPLEYVEVEAIQSFMEGFTKADPTRQWTLGEAAEYMGVGGYCPMVAGSPETVADDLIGWMEDTGVDGFNVHYIVSPGDIIDFVDMVIPELQRRGVYKTSYEEGAFREKLFGRGSRYLPDDHPAADYRYGRPKFDSATDSTDRAETLSRQ